MALLGRKKLVGVDPQLVRVVERAADLLDNRFDLQVLEGVRSLERQKQLYAAGASMTMRSEHLWGRAIDVAPKMRFEDQDGDGKDDDGLVGVVWSWPPYFIIAEAMKLAAQELSVDVEWGGDWKTFKDGPHYQLRRK